MIKTSKKLREVFDKIRPHINGHTTIINQFIESIYEVEKMEASKQDKVMENNQIEDLLDEFEEGNMSIQNLSDRLYMILGNKRKDLIDFANAINICDGNKEKIESLVDLYLKKYI